MCDAAIATENTFWFNICIKNNSATNIIGVKYSEGKAWKRDFFIAHDMNIPPSCYELVICRFICPVYW